MPTRPMRLSDESRVRAMMRALWPGEGVDPQSYDAVFVWEEPNRALGGFACMTIRSYVNGADANPCPHLEGWYVEGNLRRRGIGAALIKAAEAWCGRRGFRELTSDVLAHNRISQRAHAAIGFMPTERVQYFRKRIAPRTRRSVERRPR